MNKYASMTLDNYVEQVFLGELNSNYQSKSALCIRNAVSSFRKWYGDELLIGDIDVELLQRYEKENTLPVVRGYCRSLWRVMRTADPGRFPKYRGKPRIRKIPTGIDGPIYLLSAFYKQKYEPNALRTCRPNTKRLYMITIRKLEEFMGEPPTLDDLNDDNINRFVEWRLAQGRTAKTVNRNLFDLLALWRWAHKKGYVEDLPDVPLEVEVEETPIAWKREELERIFKSASEEEGRISGVPANVWWTTLLLVFWDTGERVSAVRGLTWENVDTEDRWIRFPAASRKGGAADNSRRIAEDTRLALESMRRWQETAENYSPDGDVFPWGMAVHYIYRKYEKILKRAGLPYDKRHKFHCLRKTAASYFEKAGGNATQLLCHSSREITEAYLDPRIVERVEGIDLLFRPNTNN